MTAGMFVLGGRVGQQPGFDEEIVKKLT